MGLSKVFSGIGHAFAWVALHVVGAAKKADAIAAEAASFQPEIQALLGLVGPQAQAIEDAVYHVAGDIFAAVHAAGDAASANGLSVSLDKAAIDKVKAVIGSVSGFAVSAPKK